jgi:hypothetical protein
MDARLSQDERRAVAKRIFVALCAHYPEHYVALIESKVAASSPERVLTTSPHRLCPVATMVALELGRVLAPAPCARCSARRIGSIWASKMTFAVLRGMSPKHATWCTGRKAS